MLATGKIAIYHRQGARVTPGVMTVDQHLLTFVSTQGLLFSLPKAELEATFTIFGLVVREPATGRSFDFVVGAYAGGHAPPFTEEQLAEVAEANTAENFQGGAALYLGNVAAGHVSNAVGSAAGVAVSFVGRGIGVYRMAKSQRDSFYVSHEWAGHLQQHGVAVTFKAHTFAVSQRRIILIVVPSFLALVAVAVGITLALS